MLQGKKILIGISGSIAAYKSILLVRLLIKAGAEVKVVMTPSAREFVSPLVLSTLSKNNVVLGLAEADEWANHVMLGRWADLMIMAPLSCNTLAKMAHGLCDNILLAVYLSATCPVVAVPAMDEDMWHHPATRQNITQIAAYGNHIIAVGKGELASGLFGEGRMAEPEDIITYITEHFFRTEELKGKKVLVTAGPTHEAIDPVRFIGNHSSGKMGFALAEELYLRGASVVLVTGPSHLQTAYQGITIQSVVSAQDMYDACLDRFPDCDLAIMSAAVADYRPESVADQKIKKQNDHWSLNLVKTKDILKQLGALKKPHQFLAGFALETQDERANAQGKMQSKNADIIVLNSLNDHNAGFGVDSNTVTLFHKSGAEEYLSNRPKKQVASAIVSFIIKHWYAQ
ncbi:MAG: bifunctional phosphopantothenoylcysteine decarboxylase/phosphopantothenate--cysteine ligase CoaBC [Chitinophagaceae bacterium]|jgi:phosphopantothenoylcysteine decarboxylase/phosphopantothenate--cysteine ligase|nr:bifunctional phosphopantothenoylcysteine decarboxylase/phosphopantothenate--cysteine ligase CoaBC [Chitinophagaceae bacterium]